MVQMIITEDTVAKLAPKAVRYDATDISCPGFGVRVYPSGSKTWFYRYRIQNTVRVMRLGQTSWRCLEEALELYREARGKHRSGLDPQGMHPTTSEAKHLLLKLWVAYEIEGELPSEIGAHPTVEALADYYGVQPSSIKKLAAFRYLRLKGSGADAVVIPMRDAINNMVFEERARLY